mmetsp:Transcript_17033/g.47219  ORF Transcript_17033/g.47219 Transcript_17033/m.47219 type:complete len:94 (+) Transcript_17033:74-355(+)
MFMSGAEPFDSVEGPMKGLSIQVVMAPHEWNSVNEDTQSRKTARGETDGETDGMKVVTVVVGDDDDDDARRALRAPTGSNMLCGTMLLLETLL